MDQHAKRHRIEWAKAYPFDIPDRSYIYTRRGHFVLSHYEHDAWQNVQVEQGGRRVPLRDVAGQETIDELLQHRRHAVIACGSNASPQRLAQKFGDDSCHGVVPTLRVTLHDYAIVYAADFTLYGSIPATLAHTPGAKVPAFINLLTDEQITVMDKTEGGYERNFLPAQSVEFEQEMAFGDIYAYLSLHECLTDGHSAIALSSVKGEGIPHKTMDQVEVLSLVQGLLGVTGHLDDFIHENITDSDLRRSRGRKLKDHHSHPAQTRKSD